MSHLEIRHISFVPFMFSGPCDPTGIRWQNSVEQLRAQTSGSEAALTMLEARQFAPTQPSKLLFDCAGVRLGLFLLPVGVGVFQVMWPTTETESIDTRSNILLTRRTRHQELMEGTNTVGAKIHTIIKLARKVSSADVKLPSFIVRDLGPCPYVFSSYFFRPYDDQAEEECKHIIRDLLQPSRRGISDEDWERFQQLEAEAAGVSEPPTEQDWDLRESVYCHMSWASVVARTRTDQDDVVALYSVLECRLQAAWCLSHVIGGIEGFHRRLTDYQVELVAATLETGLRELASVRDATASERTKRLYEGMVATSGLQGKIEEARQHVSMLRALATSRGSRLRERFELITELLLFAILCLQLLPLIQSDPLEGAARTAMIIGVGVFALLYVVVRWKIRR